MRIEADWVGADFSRAVMDALSGQGYFVGGCVRNALLGVPVADVDVATPLSPEVVIQRLERDDIKVIPTGLKHGTITAVYRGTPVEITTFRRDVETDGRHATVAFTDDIAQDAGRRDFTMNALYADRNGEIVDPLGGLQDLEDRLVRFIGVPQDRIREDYLRILRFFRFHAWYGAPGIDAEGLAACAELADGITRLARERVGWEVRKLLSADNPAPAVASMQVSGVLMRCLPGSVPDALPVLIDLEQRSGQRPDWLRRLAVLGGEDHATALRLSKTEGRTLTMIQSVAEAVETDAVAAYRHGAEIAVSGALVRAASTGTGVSATLGEVTKLGAQQRMPVTAKDLSTRGIAPGPEIGRLLQEAEARWIASGFTLDKAVLLQEVLQ